MKKNLRIVSAAAAALLAVAPVAAAAVSTVSADVVTSATNLGAIPAVQNGTTVNVTPNVSLNTATLSGSVKSAISVSFSATVNGTTATSTFNPSDQNKSSVSLFRGSKEITSLDEVSADAAGSTYRVVATNVGLNFGTQNANKKIVLTFPEGDSFTYQRKEGRSQEVTLDQNGAIVLSGVSMNVTAKDFASPAVVTWFNAANNAPVTSGNIEVYAGSDAGKMNVAQVAAAAQAKYAAANGTTNSAIKENSNIKYSNNLKDALKALNITVDAQGWFVAPKSFTFNLVATASNNDASATLPVTVTVPNGKEATPAQETTKNVTVMHIATIYDKNGKATQEPALRAYNSVSVVTEPVTINGAKFYKLAGKDQYVKVGNIDGTKRTLKHNAYVYKSNGKAYTTKSGKKVVKTKRTKGTEVTTYGKSFMINGSQMYRVGKNQYIKKANF